MLKDVSMNQTEISRRAALKKIAYGGGALLLAATGSYFVFRSPRIADDVARALTEKLSGEVILDRLQLGNYSRDFGRLIEKQPRVVVKPADEKDIRSVFDIARKFQVPVQVRGNGQSCMGQSLSDGGIVLHTQKQETEIEIDGNEVWADAGISVKELQARLKAKKLCMPIAPSDSQMTLGGLLSAGGLGAASIERGLLVDYVRELELIAPHGGLLRCSAVRNRDMFLYSLGGLGQLGVLHRVRLVTVRHQPFVKLAEVRLPGPGAIVELLQFAMQDHLQGRISFFQADLSYSKTMVTLGRAFETAAEADAFDPALILPESRMLVQAKVVQQPHFDFYGLNEEPDTGKAKGYRVWADLLFPNDRWQEYFERLLILARNSPKEVQPHSIRLFPIHKNDALRLPYGAQVADGKRYNVLIGTGYALPSFDPDALAKVEAFLEKLQDVATRMKARPYLTGWYRLDEEKKRAVFGDDFNTLKRLKNDVDPDRLLNPGVWIENA